MKKLMIITGCLLIFNSCTGDTNTNIENNIDADQTQTSENRIEKSKCNECDLERIKANNEMWGTVIDYFGECNGETIPCDPQTGKEPVTTEGEERAKETQTIFNIYTTNTNTLQNDSTVDPADVLVEFYTDLSAEGGEGGTSESPGGVI